ncbi:MAG: metal-sensitive transcriptional regulator [Sporomusaceae bacterium]|nr:metal-sensitive transcriptional regulator [Sporomusaceae bacterium]
MLNDHEKNDIKKRLRKTGGQISGIEKMVDEGRYCVEVLQQISAARAALNKVALMILESHTKSCVVTAIQENRTEDTVEELIGIISKFTK